MGGATTSYCHTGPALGHNKFGGGEPSKESKAAGIALPDTALSNLPELLVDGLGADIATGILLDEETISLLEYSVRLERMFEQDDTGEYTVVS
jgi:hypothetical protein